MPRRFRFRTAPEPERPSGGPIEAKTLAERRAGLKRASGEPTIVLPFAATFMGVGIQKASEFEIAVATPYHPEFPPVARRLGGRWAKPLWVFDNRDEPQVRDALRKVYGTDGTPIPREDMWEIRVRLLPRINYGRQLWGVGREIVSRRESNWNVRYGTQVRLLQGSFAVEGGTQADPQIAPLPPYVEFRIRDVPPIFLAPSSPGLLQTFSAQVDLQGIVRPSVN